MVQYVKAPDLRDIQDNQIISPQSQPLNSLFITGGLLDLTVWIGIKKLFFQNGQNIWVVVHNQNLFTFWNGFFHHKYSPIRWQRVSSCCYYG